METVEKIGKKKKKKINVVFISISVVFAIYSLFIILPYVYGFLVSIETDFEYQNTIFPKPHGFEFSNYFDGWVDLANENTSVPTMFINSIWYAGGMAIVGLMYASVTAYVVSKYRFPCRKIIYTAAIVMITIPIIGGMASNLKFVSALGGYNSPLFVFISAQTINGSFIILVACFDAVDWGYAEAAFIDGAGHFQVFFKIMLPQIISPLCALAMTDFIMYWADTDTALIYFPNLSTLSTGMYLYQDVVERLYNYPIYYAGLMMCMIPTIVLFIIFQKHLMEIQMGGGLKG